MNKWTKQYNNDVGPNDDSFEEWFEVTDGMRIFRCEESEDADFLLSALTQPSVSVEQEPVGSLSVRYHRGCKSMTNTDFDYNGDLPEGDYELYTTPPQRKPLTEDDAQDIIKRALQSLTNDSNTFKLSGNMIWVALVKEVESALRSKNT